jgi:hypothetical protein
MSDPLDPVDPPTPDGERRERRKRRAAVFGDVLPDATSDERGDWGGDRPDATDDWLRGQVPPHHG